MCLYTPPVTRHLVAASVANVLFLERLVPDRGVAAKRSTEGGVERHQVVDVAFRLWIDLPREKKYN